MVMRKLASRAALAAAALMTAGGAMAADANAQPSGGIETIVVSAERRDTSVQNVPSGMVLMPEKP